VTQESELLRAFREAFEEGNRAWNSGDMKSAYANLPDELEYRLTPTWPEARVLLSRAEVVAFFEDFQKTFPDARTTPLEFIEVGEGVVIVGFRVTGSGRASGVGTTMDIWQVWKVETIDNGSTTTRITEYTDRQEALKAAGVVKAGTGSGP
jgi:ketosteroid isomerase-like protein